MTDTPDTPPPPSAPPPPASGGSGMPAANLIKIAQLVSGIFNAISAFWIAITGLILIIAIVGCVILPIAAAPAALAYFEIKNFLALNDDAKPNPTKKHLNLIAILEICTIIFGNVPGLVCGIITITQLKDYPDDPPGV